MQHTLEFMPGTALARRFFEEAIGPLMAVHAPGLPFAAALLGTGSDVLGYDTARSMDHDWGPRQLILLREEDLDGWRDRLDQMFLASLPATVAGFPTRYAVFADEPGTVYMAVEGAMHRIQITSLPRFLQRHLGIQRGDEIDVVTWVTVSEQQVLEITAGAVFHDGLGDLSEIRRILAWYPDDVWRYRMAAGWKRIAQVEPFVGRTGDVGDDLGSHVIGLSLVRDVMRLALLQARHYAPYPKWLGTAFARVPDAAELMPWLDRARFSVTWQDREAGTVGAVRILAERHNALGLTEHIDPTPRPFHQRPFTVMDAERFADALTASIQDPAVQALPAHLGGIDQYLDSTDAVVNNEDMRQVLRAWLRSR
jgi:hypothetical protein